MPRSVLKKPWTLFAFNALLLLYRNDEYGKKIEVTRWTMEDSLRADVELFVD